MCLKDTPIAVCITLTASYPSSVPRFPQHILRHISVHIRRHILRYFTVLSMHSISRRNSDYLYKYTSLRLLTWRCISIVILQGSSSVRGWQPERDVLDSMSVPRAPLVCSNKWQLEWAVIQTISPESVDHTTDVLIAVRRLFRLERSTIVSLHGTRDSKYLRKQLKTYIYYALLLMCDIKRSMLIAQNTVLLAYGFESASLRHNLC